jgi:hypothetical protein
MASVSGKSGKKKTLLIISLILLLVALPGAVFLVGQRQKIQKKAADECNSDPQKCWLITSQSSQEDCEAWCSAPEQDEYEDTCHPYNVLNDDCDEVTCWYCELINPPAPAPGGCQSPYLDKRTKEACERACSCEGWDLDNSFEDTCQQGSDQCWYCEERETPLDDCCQATCQSLTAYDEDWQLLTGTSVQAGDKLRFIVRGTTLRTTITNARFRLNGGEWQIPSGQHEGNFYFEQTFSQAGNYKIEAMVYSEYVGWK